jgi:hypothetical protein
MSRRVIGSRSLGLPLAALLLLGLMASPAAAYVGPGAGLTVIGSLVAVGAAVLIALVGLVLFPLRLLMKKMKAAKAEPDTGEA